MGGSEFVLRLFGGLELRRGRRSIVVPASTQPLLSFLALNPRPSRRAYIAGLLWPDQDPVRATANLRTALWRLRHQNVDLIECKDGSLSLSQRVWVDTRPLHAAAVKRRRTGALPDPELLLNIRGELLPGFWDSWLVFDRERLRQESVQLLEESAEACLLRSDVHRAILLALCAVECDELRESAIILLLRAYLAAGSTGRAVRQAMRYAALLETELGVGPPEFVEQLLWKHRKALRHRLPVEEAGDGRRLLDGRTRAIARGGRV